VINQSKHAIYFFIVYELKQFAAIVSMFPTNLESHLTVHDL